MELFHSYSTAAWYSADQDEMMRKARHAAETAVKLDPGDAEAHAVLATSLGLAGDFAKAEAEFETALRMAPNAAEILIFYSGWASTFGDPQRGAEVIDRVIHLDPNYPMWASTSFAIAYFMADRSADSLVMIERMSPDNYTNDIWALKASALAEVGRMDEAREWVAKALEARPQLSAEWMRNQTWYNERESQRYADAMRVAGFPLCSTLRALKAVRENPIRLPECQASAPAGG